MQKSVQANVKKEDRYVSNAFKYIFLGLWKFFMRKKMHSTHLLGLNRALYGKKH